MQEFLILSTLSLVFWFTQKLTDGHHEHGMNFFPGAKIFFGVVSGAIAYYLIQYSPVLLATYVSLILYWFSWVKIDNIGHLVMAYFMLFWGFLAEFPFPFFDVFGLFTAYVGFNYLKHHNNSAFLRWFFQYKLHFFLIPLVYALVIGNIYGFSTVVFNLFGTFIANRMFHLKRGV